MHDERIDSSHAPLPKVLLLLPRRTYQRVGLQRWRGSRCCLYNEVALKVSYHLIMKEVRATERPEELGPLLWRDLQCGDIWLQLSFRPHLPCARPSATPGS